MFLQLGFFNSNLAVVSVCNQKNVPPQVFWLKNELNPLIYKQ